MRIRYRGFAVPAMLLERSGAPKAVEVLVLDDGVPDWVAISVGGEGVPTFELVTDPAVLVPQLLCPLRVR